MQRYEKRVLSKEEALDKKSEAIERREAGFTAKEEELSQQRVQELERISGLTSGKDNCFRCIINNEFHTRQCL